MVTSTKIKLLPVLFFFILLVPLTNVSAYSVEPRWKKGEFYQDTVAQFIIHGDKNQTNISCKIQYFYKENPLSNKTDREAVKWLDVPKLDINGTGLFQFVLNDSNGFYRIGGYNLTFIFGVDVINETGVELWTAPRNYTEIMVNLNQQSIIDAEIANDMRDSLHQKGWAQIIGNALIFGFAIFIAFVILLIIREIKPTDVWRKFKIFCGNGAQYIKGLWSSMKLKKAFRTNPAIYFNLLGTLFSLEATDIEKNQIKPLEKKLNKAYDEYENQVRLSENYFKKEEEVIKADIDRENANSEDVKPVMEMPKVTRGETVPSNPGHKKSKPPRKKKKND